MQSSSVLDLHLRENTTPSGEFEAPYCIRTEAVHDSDAESSSTLLLPSYENIGSRSLASTTTLLKESMLLYYNSNTTTTTIQ